MSLAVSGVSATGVRFGKIIFQGARIEWPEGYDPSKNGQQPTLPASAGLAFRLTDKDVRLMPGGQLAGRNGAQASVTLRYEPSSSQAPLRMGAQLSDLGDSIEPGDIKRLMKAVQRTPWFPPGKKEVAQKVEEILGRNALASGGAAPIETMLRRFPAVVIPPETPPGVCRDVPAVIDLFAAVAKGTVVRSQFEGESWWHWAARKVNTFLG